MMSKIAPSPEGYASSTALHASFMVRLFHQLLYSGSGFGTLAPACLLPGFSPILPGDSGPAESPDCLAAGGTHASPVYRM